MGKSFKLQHKSITKNSIKKEQVNKIIYDHCPTIKVNPQIISEFKKNMENPSYIWNGEELFNKYTENNDDLDIFKDQEND